MAPRGLPQDSGFSGSIAEQPADIGTLREIGEITSRPRCSSAASDIKDVFGELVERFLSNTESTAQPRRRQDSLPWAAKEFVIPLTGPAEEDLK